MVMLILMVALLIKMLYKEGENTYKETAEQITYYNTNIENIKSIVAEV